jgi:hypothetical protein
MRFTDEMLMAYADGELDPVTRGAIEDAMSRDPALARAVDRHRAMAERVRGAYGHVLEEPVPERLAALATGTADAPAPVTELATRREERSTRAGQWRLPAWAAAAASLAVGLFVGFFLAREPTVPYAERDGALVARGALDAALTTQIATAGGNRGVHVGISFRDRDGDYCRTFHLQREASVAGLACRRGEGWTLEVLAATPVVDGELRTAAAMPLPVLQAVDASIDGEPLDAAAEAAARDAGWRNARNVAE